MLTRLHIRNYAIIKEIEIQFQEGLTIITGETGAGKSILMGALSLVLGERADLKSLFIKDDKCFIEAVFDIENLESVKTFLVEHDLDTDHEVILRREINPNGKTRAFINDTPVTLDILSSLASKLIDLHRQFDTQQLQQSSEHLHLLDEVCAHQDSLRNYQHQFKNWKSLQLTYQVIVSQNQTIKQELDYHQFLFEELATFQPKEGELELIEQELFLLTHSEALKNSLQYSLHQLKERDDSILSMIKGMSNQLESHADKVVILQELNARIQSTHIELKEIAAEIESLQNATQPDEARMLSLTERVNEGNRLLKKHHCLNDSQLVALQIQLAQKIQQAATADDEEHILQKQIDETFHHVSKLAATLSLTRKQNIPAIEQKVNALLKKVGMPNAELKVQQTTTDYNEYGNDKVDILFDANQTGNFSSIAKVASGGELSRLMLCLKSLLAHSTSLPTLIFDEIDTGISGETAMQVGQILKELSANHQLISITHLPQIAGKAHHHLFIYKQKNTVGHLETHIKVLKIDERIEVLAEMLSGKKINEKAREMVKQLME
ncbi:MAG: DNA repair protein RecN [Bacteroidetes bacterium]|nr:DNA repair protein RecN [Bacteroidota bacterium]